MMRIGEAQFMSLVLFSVEDNFKVSSLSLINQLLIASLELVRSDAKILSAVPPGANHAVVHAELLQRRASGAILDFQRGPNIFI